MKISTLLLLVTVLPLGLSKLMWIPDPYFANKMALYGVRRKPADCDLKCAALCTKDTTCSSFFYKEPGECLLSITIFSDREKLTNVPGFKYYRMYDEACPVRECWYRLRSELCLTIYDRDMTYEESKSFCEDLGGRLPVLPTRDTGTSVLGMLMYNEYDLDLESAPFLGAYQKNGENMTWNDGTVMESMKSNIEWLGADANKNSKPQCLKLDKATHAASTGWTKADCKKLATAVLCERPLT